MAVENGSATVDGAPSPGAPEWLYSLFARKRLRETKQKAISALGNRWAPNIADVDNPASLKIADHVFNQLGITAIAPEKAAGVREDSLGVSLERAIERDLSENLPELDVHRNWEVARSSRLWDFYQYEHLSELERILISRPELRVAFGADYSISPDVTVATSGRHRLNLLHSVVSCKWTIRSDRAQNVRQEFRFLINSRRGPTPKLVAVTAEPLPSRLSSLTRGTGELDALYHVAYRQMDRALAALDGGPVKRGDLSQAEHWQEMTSSGRLRDYWDLAEDLALD